MIDHRILAGAKIPNLADNLMKSSDMTRKFQETKEYLKNAPLRDKLMQMKMQEQELQNQKSQYELDNPQMFGRGGVPADLRVHQFHMGVINNPNSSPEQVRASKIALALEARAGSSKEERLGADPNATQNVADSQAIIEGAKSGAKEEGKLKEQLKYGARISKAKKLAEIKATEEGTIFNELNQLESAFPVLMESVADLKGLADLSTSTWGGKVWDVAVKQTGFGATEGATARAKFISIIDNQVLPLLKATFGAAFTVQEGEWLRKTMGDPDGTPQEKMAQLEAFVAQKERNMRAKQSQLNSLSSDDSEINDLQAEIDALKQQLGAN